MGLYHSICLTYGFEIPADTDIDELDALLADQPKDRESVGHVVVGDRDQLLLVTRFAGVAENTVVRLTADTLTPTDVTATWDAALHEIAVRLGHPDHPAPAWLVVHNHR
jgi:hypothetical protein